jgi:NitT/TauT family transport system permease protein/taurine transport system permease protein
MSSEESTRLRAVELGRDGARAGTFAPLWSIAVNGFVFLAPIAVVVLLWQGATIVSGWPKYLLPGPLVVAETFWSLLTSGVLLSNLLASVGRLLIGCVAAFVLAIPLGYAIGTSRIADRMLSPVVSVTQPIPGIAWIPLAVLWFGLGPAAVGFVIFLSAFFPILLNTTTGVRTVTRELIRVGRVFQFPPRMMVFDVVLPSALPYIVTGVRLGFGYGWRALVAGEMIAASSGLGSMIFEARDFLRTDEVIVGMFTIGLFWAAIERLVLRPIEKQTIEKWGLANAAA